MRPHHIVTRTPKRWQAHNLFQSKLERVVGIEIPGSCVQNASPVRDLTPPQSLLNRNAAKSLADGDADEQLGPSAAAAASTGASAAPRSRARLYEYSVLTSASSERALRKHYGPGTPQTRVVFHDPPLMNETEASNLAHISLPLLYNPLVNGLEDAHELAVNVGTILVGRYRVVGIIGKGSFSRVFQCLDLRTRTMVSVKELRNDKDCLDAGLGEVKVLAFLAREDPFGEKPLVRLVRDVARANAFTITHLVRP